MCICEVEIFSKEKTMKVICLILPILAFVNADGQYTKSVASNTQGLNTKTQQQQQQQQFSSKSSQISESTSNQNPGQYYSAQGSSYASQSVPYPAAQSSVYAAPVQDSQYLTAQNTGIYAPAVEENYPPAVEATDVQPYANQQVRILTTTTTKSKFLIFSSEM